MSATTTLGIKLSLSGASEVDGDLRRVTTGFDRLGSTAQSAQANLSRLAGAFAGALTAREILQAADAVTVLGNQLKLATGSTEAAGRAYESLFDIAQRSRVSFTELGGTYASIARAGESLGLSQERLLNVTEAIGNAMTISGGSASSMQAALVQLSQGLASGQLRGEELNSVMEQTPRLARALADGLGVSIGQLREMGKAGELSAETVIRALERQASVLRGEVAGATVTVSQAMTVLQNGLTKAVGDFDQVTRSSASLAGAIAGVGRAVGDMGRVFRENETSINLALGILGGTATAGGLALVATRLGTVATAVGGVAGAIGLLQVAVGALNPVTLTLLGLGAAVGGAVAWDNHYRKTADGIRETMKQLEEANRLASGNLERMQGRPEVVDQINRAIGERTKRLGELRTELGRLQAAELAAVAPIGSVGSGDTALARAQRQAYDKAIGLMPVSKDSRLEQIIAEAKLNMGSMFDAKVEKVLRELYGKKGSGDTKKTKDTDADREAKEARKNDFDVVELRNRQVQKNFEEDEKAKQDAIDKTNQKQLQWASRLDSLLADTPTRLAVKFKSDLDFLDDAFFKDEITFEEHAEATKLRANRVKKATGEMTDDMRRLIEVTQGWGRQFTDTMTEVVTGGKASFKDLADSIVKDLVRIQIQKHITDPLVKTGTSLLDGLFKDVFGGGKATGGPVNAGTPYLIGEQGPELFVPRRDGNIVPNGAFRAGSGVTLQVVNNFNGPADRAQVLTAAQLGAELAVARVRDNLVRGRM